MLERKDYLSLRNAGLSEIDILNEMKESRKAFQTEDGRKRLLQLCRRASLFEEIPHEDAETIGKRNMLVFELEEMGLLSEDVLEKALEYALTLYPDVKTDAEKNKQTGAI